MQNRHSICKTLAFSFFILSNIIVNSQTVKYNIECFKNNICRFNFFNKNLYGPSSDDSISLNIEILKSGSKFSYKIIDVNTFAKTPLYSDSLLKSLIIDFSIKNNEIELLTEGKTIYKLIKAANDKKYGKDTSSFGEYYFMMNHPKILLDTYFYSCLTPMKKYFTPSISEENRKVLVQSLGDSTIANYSTKINSENNQLHVLSNIQTDSMEAKAYLYKKLIEKQGVQIKEYMKEKDMVYLPTKITENTYFIINSSNTYFFKSQIVETKTNYGNPKDIINSFKITAIE
ncbi:MAG: hypothetical protein ABIP51_21805 [Bacteroidia bacterium]